MDSRARHLATAFVDVSNAVIAFTAECSTADWRLITQEEQWPVGVVCRHIARGFEVHPQLIQRAATGAEMPTDYTWEALHRSNAEQARAWADCTREEVRVLLRRYRDGAVAVVQALHDDQLDRAVRHPLAGDTLITVQQIVEGMIDHARVHLASVRATCAAHH